MQDTTHDPQEADDRSIDTDRLVRALTESLTIVSTFPHQFDVTHDGRTHDVDVQAGSCTCEDHQYRGHEIVCKHQCAAAVYGVFTDGVRTRLQARVLSATRELGCPHGSTSITDGHDCAGPLGRGTFPCPECINGATPGEWSAWQVLVEGERVEAEATTGPDADAPEPAIATDGGTERAPVGMGTVEAVAEFRDVSVAEQRREQEARTDGGTATDSPTTADEPETLDAWTDLERGDRVRYVGDRDVGRVLANHSLQFNHVFTDPWSDEIPRVNLSRHGFPRYLDTDDYPASDFARVESGE